MKATLKRLSLCPCGHPVLADHIPLGTEYDIEEQVSIVGTLICGGCGTRHSLPCVYVHHEKKPGYLPRAIFGL